jgi:hypothetical protein
MGRSIKVGISNRFVGRTERPKRMVPEERSVYRRRYKKKAELLPKRGSVFTQHWFNTLDCCQLAADTFLHPIHFHTSSGAMICLPLISLSYYKNNPIALHLQASHITMNEYRQRSHVPHPPIYPICENVCKWYVPLQSVAFLKLVIAFMDPFDIQMYVSWYQSIATQSIVLPAKFEGRLSVSVLRNKSFFTKYRPQFCKSRWRAECWMPTFGL